MSTRIKHIRERNNLAQMQIAYGLWPIEDQIRYAGYSVEDVSFLLGLLPSAAKEKAHQRLAAELEKPLPEDEHNQHIGTFDPWGLFPGTVGSYSSEIDRRAIQCLINVRDRETSPSDFDELFRNMLCGQDYCDYGTSPRFCFPTMKCEPLWNTLINKWRAHYAVTWPESPTP
jgi:hypothetical protein